MVAGSLLWSGVRRHHRESALPVAVAVTAALVLVNPGLTLERDWLAVLITAAAVGLGLVTGRRRAAGADLLLAAAAAVKIVTLPIALIGLIILLRRRAALPDHAERLPGRGRRWFVVAKVPPEVRASIESQFDCDRGFRSAALTACARRTAR